MIDYDLIPDGIEISPIYAAPYVLIDYAWAVLKSNTNMKESDYSGMVPIIPIGDQPEFKQFANPYIVYGYSLDKTNDPPARKSGSMAFAVRSTNFRYITMILNILGESFGRLDSSARDINNFTSAANYYPQYKGIRFGYVEVNYVEGGEPEETEGGEMVGVIQISFEYYISHSIKTKPVLDQNGNVIDMA